MDYFNYNGQPIAGRCSNFALVEACGNTGKSRCPRITFGFFSLHSFGDMLKILMNLRGFLAVVVCVFVFSAPARSYPSSFGGLPITRIVIQDDYGKVLDDPEEVTSVIAVMPGDVFSPAAISDSITYLYLKRIFSDIRVDGIPDNDGVKLVFTLTPLKIVAGIAVRGNHVLSTSRIHGALAGIEGKEVRDDKFPDYRAAIVMLYESEGYYGTTVDFSTAKTALPHRVVLQVEIREPEPTMIAAISFSGNTRFTDRQLRNVMKNRVGKPLRSDLLLDTDMASILDVYREAGHAAAKPGHVDIRFQDGKAYVSIIGNEGPRVDVRFSGNRAFSDTDLRKQLLIWSEHDVSDGILESSVDRIRNLYKDDGYADVKVSVKKTDSGTGTLDLFFEVQEGPRIIVKTIEIRGNAFFSEKQVREQLSLKESGWFRSSPYREDLLDKDIDYIEDRYAEAGYVNAAITKKVAIAGSGSKATVVIEIAEGPQARVGQVGFDGNTAFTEPELLAMVALKPGAPYNERLLEEDRYRILSAYSNKGFLYARVDVEKKQLEDTADVKYKIAEDRQVRIGRIVLRGNERTKEKVIMREVLLQCRRPL